MYKGILQQEQVDRLIRQLQRKKYRSKEEEAYLARVAGTNSHFQGLNQRQRRKRERQVHR